MVNALNIGCRLEPFVDDHLLRRMDGVFLHLHHPTPREVILKTDRPWEGNSCGYMTVFRDGDLCRMYYGLCHLDIERGLREGKDGMKEGSIRGIGYLESADGIHWERPRLGLYEHEGSRENNIVFRPDAENPRGHGGFSPFRDSSSGCKSDERYKAVGSGRGGLYALKSPDGLHWSLLRDQPILTSNQFDSQNLAFWDAVRGEYRCYMRGVVDGRRHVRTAVSDDFVNWSEPEYIACPGAPDEELYTNQVIPYYRAPHVFVGFPTRYVVRRWSETTEALPDADYRMEISTIKERYGADLTDGLFMSSRDGDTFRRWGEAFLRPGPQRPGTWFYGDYYQCWGMLETPSALAGAPSELSFYSTENAWHDGMVFRRYTLRIDGFVSVRAPRLGGEFVTHPLTFGGEELSLNMSTSAAGHIRVEVQDISGRPIDGLALVDCIDIVGDQLDARVRWRSDAGLAALAGTPVRLRVVLSDADIYALQFRDAGARS